jgi:glycosyltransferase involved in cell wall biosynthesis
MTRYLKILYVMQCPIAGVATHLHMLVRWASEAGHDVHVVCQPGYENIDALAGVATVWPRPMKRAPQWRDASNVLFLRRLIRRERFDLVHAHSSKGGALTRLAVAGLKDAPPVLYTPHGYGFRNQGLSPLARRFFGVIERMLSPFTDGVVALSSEEERDAKRTSPKATTFRARNGVPFPPEREPSGSPEAGPIVAFIGRLVDLKGVDVLLDAVPGFIDAGPDVGVWIIGDGPERPALERRARERGVDARVRFLGFRRDLSDVWPQIDILVIPSRNEAQPFTLLEGLAAGCAIVASDVGGIPDLVTDGENGLLVAAERPGELADAVRRVIVDVPLRERLGRNARSSAQTAEMMTDDHRAIYAALVDRHDDRTPASRPGDQTAARFPG